MKHTARIAWNVLTNYAREVLLALLALIVNPLLFRWLGEEAYGVFALVLVAEGFLYLLDVGVTHAVARFVSRYLAQGRPEQISAVVSTALAIYAVLGLLAFGLTAGLGPPLLPFFQVPEHLLPAAVVLVRLVGLGLGIRFFCYAFEGALRGFERFDFSNLSYLTERAVFAATVLPAIYFGEGGLVAVGLCSLAAVVAGNILRVLFTFRHFPQLRLRPSLLSRSTFAEIARFGGMASLTQVASFSQGNVTRLLIAGLLGTTLLGYYNLLMIFVSLLLRAATAVSIVVMPSASRFEATQDTARLQALLLGGSRLILTIVVPAAVWLMVMSTPLTLVWVGPELAAYALVLTGLVAVHLPEFVTGAGEMVLLGAGHAKVLGLLYVSTSGIIIGAAALLLWLTELGLFAPVIALGLGFGVRRLILIVYMCRRIGLPTAIYLREVLAPVLVAGAGTALTLGLLRWGLEVFDWPRVILTVVVGGGIHLALSWFLVLNQAERGRVGQLLHDSWRRLARVREPS